VATETTTADDAVEPPRPDDTDNEVADTVPENTADPAPPPSGLDEIALGTALFIAEGTAYLFSRGDSIFDVCTFGPDFGLGDAELGWAQDPELGSLVVRYNDAEEAVVVGIRPDVGYVAGSGEDVAPYIEAFGIDPPPVSPLQVSDRGVFGELAVVNVFTQESVNAFIAVRCA
jgi:hypothetical protein